MDATLVVAKYNEDVFWLNYINLPYIVYNKGETIDNIEFTVTRDNVGRESETYLYYIIQNYHKLPNHVIFCQGDPFYHCKDFINTVNNADYNNINYIASLSDWNETEHPNENGYFHQEANGILLTTPLLKIPWVISPVTFATGAQYIIPKSFILNKSHEWWVNCYKVHNQNKRSPWIFERLWPIIFNYEEKI
jgi:hypothetical protein